MVQSGGGLLRYRARVLYDGTSFAGSQDIGPECHTVFGELNKALNRRFKRAMLWRPLLALGASRTDAGVHSRGNACHFDVPADLAPDAADLSVQLNRMLPRKLRLSHVELAPERDFRGLPWHARHSAQSKLYSYRLQHGTDLEPMERLYRYEFPRRLDLDAMQEASRHLTGNLDYAALAARQDAKQPPILLPPAETTRTVHSINLVDEGGGRLRFDFHLRGALRRMVRAAVGLLLDIGQGRCVPSDVPRLLEARDRSKLPSPAPARGLTLESVHYKVGWGGAYASNLNIR